LYSTFFTSSAENLAAFCLLTISSSFGCFHVPVVGVDGVDCATGVEGRTGVDIAKRIGMRRPGLLKDCEAVNLKHVVECQQREIEINSPSSGSDLAAVCDVSSTNYYLDVSKRIKFEGVPKPALS
jgi:hypothetical protein